MKDEEFLEKIEMDDGLKTLREYGENRRRRQRLEETIDRMAAAETSARQRLEQTIDNLAASEQSERRTRMIWYVISAVAACLLLLWLVLPLSERELPELQPTYQAQSLPADSSVREQSGMQADNSNEISDDVRPYEIMAEKVEVSEEPIQNLEAVPVPDGAGDLNLANAENHEDSIKSLEADAEIPKAPEIAHVSSGVTVTHTKEQYFRMASSGESRRFHFLSRPGGSGSYQTRQFSSSQGYATFCEEVKKDYNSLYLHKDSYVSIERRQSERFNDGNTLVHLREPGLDTFRSWTPLYRYNNKVLHFYHNRYVADTNRIRIECDSTIHKVIIEPGASLRVDRSWPDFAEDCEFILLTDSSGNHGELIFEGESLIPEKIRKYVRYEPAPKKKSRLDKEPVSSCWFTDNNFLTGSLRAILSSPFADYRFNSLYNPWPFFGMELDWRLNFLHPCSGWEFSAGLCLHTRITRLRHPEKILGGERQSYDGIVENIHSSLFSSLTSSILSVYLSFPMEFSHDIPCKNDYSVVLGITPAMLLADNPMNPEMYEWDYTGNNMEILDLCNRMRLDFHVGVSTPLLELGLYANPFPTYRAGVGEKPMREFGIYLKR